MGIIDSYSDAVIKGAYQKGFNEKERRKTIREATISAVAMIGLALLFAILFGSIKLPVFWLFLAGAIFYGCLNLLAWITLASPELRIFLLLFLGLSIPVGFYFALTLPADPFVMLCLFGGIICFSQAIVLKLALDIIKNQLKRGSTFPELKRRQHK